LSSKISASIINILISGGKDSEELAN